MKDRLCQKASSANENAPFLMGATPINRNCECYIANGSLAKAAPFAYAYIMLCAYRSGACMGLRALDCNCSCECVRVCAYVCMPALSAIEC